MYLGEQDEKGGENERKVGAEIQHGSPLVVMRRGVNALLAWGARLFIISRSGSGRDGPSANGSKLSAHHTMSLCYVIHVLPAQTCH